jgi:hypothetical protein
VNDPARGHRKLSLAALRRGYSGVALIAQPGPAFRPVGSPRQPFLAVAGLLRPGRWWLALLGAAVLAESLLLPLMILLVGDAIGDELAETAASWRFLALSLAGLLIAYASQRWLADVALGAITRPVLCRLNHDLAYAPTSFIQARGSVALAGRLQVAEYPATTAVHIVMAGIRLAVAMPLLVLILARIHPLVAVVALTALTASYFMQQSIGQTAASPGGQLDEESRPRADEETEIPRQRRRVQVLGEHLAALSRVVYSRATGPSGQPGLALRRPRLEMWLPILRPCLVLLSAIAVGVFMAMDTDAMPRVIVALLASWYAFRLVKSAADTIGMLYMLPESLVQLFDTAQEPDVAERAA